LLDLVLQIWAGFVGLLLCILLIVYFVASRPKALQQPSVVSGSGSVGVLKEQLTDAGAPDSS
jgi:hypothetical protein